MEKRQYWLLHSNNRKEPIQLNDRPFDAGGEGRIFHIQHPSKYRGFCAKLFINDKIVTAKARKIAYMIRHKPQADAQNYIKYCWPEALIQEGRHPIGFLMPLSFRGSLKLDYLLTPEFEGRRYKEWANKYSRVSPKGFINRMKLCRNIAIATDHFHRQKQFTIVDFNPGNILVTIDGRISIIDCDSVQILTEEGQVFNCRVGNMEYTPPEGAKKEVSRGVIPRNWHYYSLAIIFYKILFGIHPFSATANGPFAEAVNLPQKIRLGLFVYGKQKKHLDPIPDPHKEFYRAPSSIQSLFKKTFEAGHQTPGNRPSPTDWKIAFDKALKNGFMPSKTIFYGRRKKVKSPIKGPNHDPLPKTPRPTPLSVPRDAKLFVFNSIFGRGFHFLYQGQTPEKSAWKLLYECISYLLLLFLAGLFILPFTSNPLFSTIVSKGFFVIFFLHILGMVHASFHFRRRN